MEIKKLKKEIEDLRKEVIFFKEKGLVDSLTGLRNRRAHDLKLEEYQNLIERYKGKKDTKNFFWYIMIDLDNFKLINDNHGHLEGDNVLKKFAKILMKNIRPSDRVFRFAGDEFVILTIQADKKGIEKFLERILKNINSVLYDRIEFGASIGVAGYKDSIEGTIRRADKAMYQSKKGDIKITFAE